MPIPLLGIGLSLLGAAGKFGAGLAQDKASKGINPIWKQYETNPYAKAQLGLAQQLFGGRMAGAGNLERNIAGNQADLIKTINRGATDASQALLMAGQSQGQSNEAYTNLANMEAQNKYNMLGNLNNAYGQMVKEGDKEYQSMFDKFQMDAQRKDALKSSSAQNKFGALGDLASMAFMGNDLGWFKGFGGGSKSVPLTKMGGMAPKMKYNPATGQFE